MEFKIEITDEGFELTLGGKIYVYGRLSQVLTRIESAVMAIRADEPAEPAAAATAKGGAR